jgi:hypothetical protein
MKIRDHSLSVEPVDGSDLTFVVQGPIFTEANPNFGVTTKTALDSLRKYFPGSPIILSTYTDSDLNGLSYDQLVETNEAQEPYQVAKLLGTEVENSINRQICTSRKGLELVKTPLACKTRSDNVFTSNRLLQLRRSYEKQDRDFSFFKERLLIPNYMSRNPRHIVPLAYHFSDTLVFGLAEDVLSFFDLPYTKEPEHTCYFDIHQMPEDAWDPCAMRRFHSEQYFLHCIIQRHMEPEFEHQLDIRPELFDRVDRILVNNFVIHDLDSIGLKFVLPLSLGDRISMYHHRDWELLYGKWLDQEFPCRPYSPLYRLYHSVLCKLLNWRFLYRRKDEIALPYI